MNFLFFACPFFTKKLRVSAVVLTVSFLIVLSIGESLILIPLFIFSLMLVSFGNGTDFVLVFFR